jgi:hypothetical protein
MRKFNIILVVVMLVISGMHFSLAGHFCHGKLFSTSFTLKGYSVACNMAGNPQHNSKSGETSLSSRCCENHVLNFVVDDYKPSPSELMHIPFGITFHLLPEVLGLNNFMPQGLFTLNISPPGTFYQNPVSPSMICVFRI